MANKIVCDICGKECSDSGRYELWYKCVIRKKKEDICFECLKELRNFIRSKQGNTRFTSSGDSPRLPKD